MDEIIITNIKAREVLDSRGNPTIECDVKTDLAFESALVPSGASVGEKEAIELRDGGKRYHGRGVEKAVKNVNEKIAPLLIGENILDQKKIDSLMLKADNTENKSHLGANAILSVSLACARTAASSLRLPLYKYLNPNSSVIPIPLMNIINGGAHAGNSLEFQEFMIMPVNVETFKEALRIGSETYHELKIVLKEKYGKSAINVGDEGGFAPPMKDIEEPFEMIVKAEENLGYEKNLMFAIDAAPSYFYDKKTGKYTIGSKKYTNMELLEVYRELVSKYNILSIEDPFYEEDYEGFAAITKELNIQIVGDDIFVTDPELLKIGIKKGVCNALLLKINQIGTMTEAMEAAELAFRNKYNVVVSHRSGETEDTSIADISVALDAGQIKTGATCRGERVAKYNRLLKIEEENERSIYAGKKFKYPT
ncbi:MAG: phosphopyruvate hydratase [Methanomicrobia archaeon]|nr:phosphopyruvate hydratase [Methanomicrobia archaeon]